MKTSGDPYSMDQATQDRLAQDPRWTPALSGASSASNSAFFFGTMTEAASKVVFDHGIWPAAMAIWSEGIGGGQAAPLFVRKEDARWRSGALTATGMQPLPLERLAEKIYEMGLVTGAMVHGFNRWEWAEAEFAVDGESIRRPLDGLAVRHAASHYRVIDRTNMRYPDTRLNNAQVTYYSPVGVLAAIAIQGSGAVKVLKTHTYIECGRTIVPELVSGQAEGGIAMGIGHVLHEWLPLYEDGPGNGQWNLNRYHVPMARDVPVWSQELEVLEPLSDTDPHKAVAEVVMIPIVAAVVNAVAHATGKHLHALPLSQQAVREAML
jgi:CO/xanthine dehydrogenase Mo-binding subunit